MVEVRENYATTLSEDLINNWHEILFSDSRFIKGGSYRTSSEPMVIVSGSIGKEEVHYKAPPSDIVPKEMKQFIAWYNAFVIESHNIKESLIKTAIAHLYFETVHPFEDGNGRIGRAVAEKAMSQGVGRSVLLSLSDTIESNKSSYYDALKKAQRSNEITEWIYYFVDTILDAQKRVEQLIDFTLRKVRFFDRFEEKLNERQQKVIRRMLDEGPEGFEGGMSARKYVGIAQTSKATATRDMQHLLEIGAFRRLGEAGGGSTRYEENLE